ncbi:MAG TPA: hypothetical protein VMV92_37315 [Streptosporangiaceae bacterium]|nr:hypothetical protein [Streptosporangiaceae bacterium]
MHIYGYPVAIAAVLGAAAFVLKAYRLPGRPGALLAGLTNYLIFGALFCATIGVTIWLDAIAGLVGTGPGVLVLYIVLLLFGAGFVFEVVIRHMHHPIRTQVIAAVFGPVAAIAWGESARLLSRAARSPGQTAHALGSAMSQIRSGQAAAAVAPHQRIVVFVIGALVVAAFIYALHYAGTRMRGTPRMARKKGGGRSAQQALPPGQGSQQAALTAGKRGG